jgi:TolB-like protein/Tfp pilus assembly protein PilF
VWRNRAIAAVIVLSVALIAAIGVITWKSELLHRPVTTGIAVLPFENLSNDREDASFADGVQDDLVTKLANIADLKVIRRTSVMQYRGEHNARQIGDALRVSHLLEGSVRKTGAWLHINAQLIDTRTDSHVWAKQYDSDLNELFAIQSEIARTVAEQLHAKISPAEKRAIERPPTANLTAFDLYSRAKSLVMLKSYRVSGEANLRQAADLLNEAVAHDPTFFQAYCLLAHTHDLLYFFGLDRTPARLALAEAAIQAAFHLRQDAGEAHLARAAHLYQGYLDYDGALAELGIAGRSLPNDPQVLELIAYIKRRQGKEQEAVGDLERALELDPRNVVTLQQLGISYGLLHRYADERAIFDRVLVIEPDDITTMLARAGLEIDLEGNVRPLHQLLDRIRAKDPARVQDVADSLLICALAERDTAAANSALMSLGPNRRHRRSYPVQSSVYGRRCGSHGEG